jgi:hypothetical protein
MNRFINENIKPGEQIETSSTPQITTTTPTNSILSKIKSTDIQSEVTNNKSNEQITLNQWISTQSNTNAIQLIRHILTNETRMNK